MTIAPQTVSLSADEQAAVLAQLRSKFPGKSDHQLLGYISGSIPSLPEDAPTNQQAFDRCTQTADKIYHEAVTAANGIGNKIARAIALAVAFGVWVAATLECYAENS